MLEFEGNGLKVSRKEMIRLLSFSIVSALVFIGIAPGLGVGIASAESGNISVSYDATKTYTQGAAGNPSTTLFTKIFWDSADYNKINDFKVSVNTPFSYTFAHDFESTAFTITSGGSGGGMAWYDKNSSKLYWVFYGSDTFTSSPLTLIYSTNIWVNVTNDADYTFSWTLDANNPLSVGATDGNNGQIRRTYIASMSAATTDHYVISYPGSGLFTAAITKGVLQTKHYIHSQTIEYTHEATFNTAPYQFTGNYNDGLYINVTLSNGAYTNVLVNSTSSGMPTPPPTPVIDPITGVGIIFDQSSYALGAIANISWIRTSSTPFLDTDSIVLVHPGGTEEELVSSPLDSGYTKVLMSVAGTYKVEFRRSSILFGTSALASATATVGAESPSYIYAPAQVASGKLFNVTYKVGFTQTASPWIKTYRWIGSDWAYEQAFSITGTKDVETNTSILVKNTGNYLIKLCDSLLGCKASTSTTSYFNGSESTLNITVSNITIDKAAYSYGEYIATTVYVDNSNWSNKAISVDYLNYNTGITNNQQYVQNQVESFNLYISDLVFPAPGNSALRLIGKNDTGTYVLAYKNFTLSSLDAEGYGLSILGNQSCTGDTGQIKVVVPAGEVANLSISADNAIYNKDYVMNGSKIVPYTFKISGTYYITLRVNNEAKRLIIVNIKSCVVATPTSTPSVSEASNDIVNLFTQKIFWALIFIVGLALMVAKRERKG